MNPRPWPSLFAVCAVAVLAAGCTPFRAETPEAERTPAAAARPDPAETRLAEAAERAEAALTMLARIRAAEAPPPAAEVPSQVPAALRRPLTLDWIGPLETLAETLAGHAGYRLVVAGASPARPVMIAIEAANRPVIEVLRNAGIQAGAAATLTVDAGQRTVRLDWTGEDPGTRERRSTEERPGTGERPGTAAGSGGS